MRVIADEASFSLFVKESMPVASIHTQEAKGKDGKGRGSI